MATIKKGDGTTARRRTKSAAKQPAVTPPQEPNDTPTHNGAAAAGPNVEMSIEIVRVRAYELFLARGATHGDDLGDWLNAERELRGAEKR